MWYLSLDDFKQLLTESKCVKWTNTVDNYAISVLNEWEISLLIIILKYAREEEKIIELFIEGGAKKERWRKSYNGEVWMAKERQRAW